MKPFWVTFYSYKGGVGRSMALANLAAMLARRGRRVFMIDFDLEAPGLDSFRELGVESGHPGVVEYAYDFTTTGIAPDLNAYVQQCRFQKPVSGMVWLMPSGMKDRSYNSKRVSLNWEQLYENHVGGLFVENWKAAVFRKYRPDYVFVDSRTGLTDVGGICTLHLPDLVLLLFGLNDQNLHGTAAVLQTIRSGVSGKPPQVIPVATPVPNMARTESNAFKSRLDEAESLLAMKIECTITYKSQAALVEKLFTLEATASATAEPPVSQRSSRIVDEYATLLRQIQQRNQGGLDSLISKASEACDDDNEEVADRIQKALLEDFSDRSDALYQAGQIERCFRGREEALQYWLRAFEMDQLHADAFKALRAYYRHKKDHDALLHLHETRLSAALISDPGLAEELYHEQGEEFMTIGKYAEAAKSYGTRARDLQKLDAHQKLIVLFNFCEATRRATGRFDGIIWTEAIEAFENFGLETLTVDLQANILQAIHIAYACAGSLEKAQEVLERAEKYAQVVGKTEEIFCVKTYAWGTVEQFLSDNNEMSDALKSNKLWDGTLLRVTK